MNQQILDKVRAYFLTQPVEKVWLFGSYSRGEQRIGSDVDILVRFVPGTVMGLGYFRMINELEELFQCRVDLVEEAYLHPQVVSNVDNEKIMIYERRA